MKRASKIALLSLAALGAAGLVVAQVFNPKDTEQWEPKPPVVAPGKLSGTPPTDAIRLVDGNNADQWVSANGSPAKWPVADGEMVVDKKSGNIRTKRKFKNFQLHLEWKVPANITGSGQGRGNSGVFLAATGKGDRGYELQILDSWRNETYVNGQAGAVYKQHPPLANPARPPGEWQSYDIVWIAPVFDKGGTLASPARVTAFFNGVLIQNDVALSGETVFIGKPAYRAHGPAPVMLQAHGDPSEPISFRNIWLRELP